MRAITQHQPWSSLTMAGAKSIETSDHPPAGPACPSGVRAQPGYAIEPETRIAIHAAKGTTTLDGIWHRGHQSIAGDDHRLVFAMQTLNDIGSLELGEGLDPLLPTGMVLGTVRFIDAIPMEAAGHHRNPRHQNWIEVDGPADAPHTLTMHVTGPRHGYVVQDISDQLLFGHYAPGRWGWLLQDPEPFVEPVPARGAQGVWDWTPPGAPT